MENPLSRMLLDGGIAEGGAVTIGVVDGGLDFDVRRPAESDAKGRKTKGSEQEEASATS